MTNSNVKFGQGGRLYADATPDGLPWDHSDDNQIDPLPNKVVPKVLDPAAGAPPASSHSQPGFLRGVTSTILELAGMAAVSVGFFMISPALGLIVAGLAMVLLGVATDRAD